MTNRSNNWRYATERPLADWSQNISLTVFSHGRAASTRCPEKMTREIGATGLTLTHIICHKLREMRDMGVDIFFAAGDPEILEITEEYKIPIIRRDAESLSNSDNTGTIFNYTATAPGDWMLFINPCLPLLQISQVLTFLREFRQEPEPRPRFSVLPEQNYYITGTGVSVNWRQSLDHIDTKSVSPVYSFAHALYLFQPEILADTGFFWLWPDVEYSILTYPERIPHLDIDTDMDFERLEMMVHRYGVGILGI